MTCQDAWSILFCHIHSRWSGKTSINTFSNKSPVEKKKRKNIDPRTWRLPSVQYAYLQLSFFSWFRKDGKAPRKMLFWEIHQSILNCDSSSKINKINYLSWPSRTYCRPIKAQTGLEHLSAFLFTSCLPVNGFETAALELDWLISI